MVCATATGSSCSIGTVVVVVLAIVDSVGANWSTLSATARSAASRISGRTTQYQAPITSAMPANASATRPMVRAGIVGGWISVARPVAGSCSGSVASISKSTWRSALRKNPRLARSLSRTRLLDPELVGRPPPAALERLQHRDPAVVERAHGDDRFGDGAVVGIALRDDPYGDRGRARARRRDRRRTNGHLDHITRPAKEPRRYRRAPIATGNPRWWRTMPAW